MAQVLVENLSEKSVAEGMPPVGGSTLFSDVEQAQLLAQELFAHICDPEIVALEHTRQRLNQTPRHTPQPRRAARASRCRAGNVLIDDGGQVLWNRSVREQRGGDTTCAERRSSLHTEATNSGTPSVRSCKRARNSPAMDGVRWARYCATSVSENGSSTISSQNPCSEADAAARERMVGRDDLRQPKADSHIKLRPLRRRAR